MKNDNIMTASSLKELNQVVEDRGGMLSLLWEKATLAQSGRIYNWGPQMVVSSPFHGSSGCLVMAEHAHPKYGVKVIEVAPDLYVATIEWEAMKKLAIAEIGWSRRSRRESALECA